MPDLRARLSDHFHTIREALSSRSSARSWMWSKMGPPQGCFHTAHNTKADRFPAIFREVGDRLGGLESCRVLSFGCSTGEEVYSLAILLHWTCVSDFMHWPLGRYCLTNPLVFSLVPRSQEW